MGKLDATHAAIVDEEYTREQLSRRPLFTKLVIFLKVGRTRDDAWRVRGALLRPLALGQHKVNGKEVRVALETSPEMKPLIRQGAKFWQLTEKAGIPKGDIKLTYLHSEQKIAVRYMVGRPTRLATYEREGWAVQAEAWKKACGDTMTEADAIRELRES